MINFRLLFFFILFSNVAFCQKNKDVDILFSATLPLQTNSKAEIHIETLKFYLSNIQFWSENKLVFCPKNKFLLIDFEDSASLHQKLSTPKYLTFDKIVFNLGIDSATNVSGAMGGVLDPTKGMYWTWQSGYINVKLEGVAVSNSINKTNFEFHLGGYQYPNNPLQQIELAVKSTSTLAIDLDLQSFFNSINLEKTAKIMSPSATAVILSQQLATFFRIR